jgi:hypothetical protein
MLAEKQLRYKKKPRLPRDGRKDVVDSMTPVIELSTLLGEADSAGGL